MCDARPNFVYYSSQICVLKAKHFDNTVDYFSNSRQTLQQIAFLYFIPHHILCTVEV